MIPRIQSILPLPDFCLRVVFDDGKTVLYDVKEDMEQIAKLIYRTAVDYENGREEIRAGVTELCRKYPLYR